MNTNFIKDRILMEARQNGITLTEDQLNAKVLEASQIDPDTLERLSGGGLVFDCNRDHYCWSDYLCVTWNHE